MAKKVSKRKSHTGQTASGNTRDMKVDKVGKVTIYKRGSTYYLYYREAGESQRVRIDGNLSVARASAELSATTFYTFPREFSPPESHVVAPPEPPTMMEGWPITTATTTGFAIWYARLETSTLPYSMAFPVPLPVAG